MTVSKLVSTAFSHAFICHPEEHKEWIRVSHCIGGQLPTSLLMYSVQKAGQIDLFIKCMLNEFSLDNEEGEADFSFHYLVFLSELWVGHIYEIFRLLKERKYTPNNPNFENLAHDLRLLRIPIEKHEIAEDKKLKGPLLMEKRPTKNDDITYEYSKDDPKRSHIMPVEISQRGSVMWRVTNITAKKSHCIERQNIAERIFALYPSAEIKKTDT